MKNKIFASSISMVIGFVLFAAVFIVGLVVLLSLLFGSLSVHGAESTNVPALGASYNTGAHFASYLACHFSGESIS
jgi:hypothetical protein